MIQALHRNDPLELGPYSLLARLGEGGMGSVYLGQHGTERHLAAVKTIRIGLLYDEGVRDRFKREVEAAQRVSGKHVANILEADSTTDLPWYAMEYLPAFIKLSDLSSIAGPMPTRRVVQLALDLAQALDSLHEQNFIHRDVKPDNILVSSTGLRLIDFGIVRSVEQSTHTSGHWKTPGWSSPEQLVFGHEPSTKVDIYSWGLVVAFAAIGHNPLLKEGVEASAEQWLLASIRGEFYFDELDERLRELVDPALASDPGSRPEAGELVSRCERLLTELKFPVGGRPNLDTRILAPRRGSSSSDAGVAAAGQDDAATTQSKRDVPQAGGTVARPAWAEALALGGILLVARPRAHETARDYIEGLLSGLARFTELEVVSLGEGWQLVRRPSGNIVCPSPDMTSFSSSADEPPGEAAGRVLTGLRRHLSHPAIEMRSLWWLGKYIEGSLHETTASTRWTLSATEKVEESLQGLWFDRGDLVGKWSHQAVTNAFPNHGKKWRNLTISKAERLVEEGISLSNITSALGRTPGALVTKLHEVGTVQYFGLPQQDA